MKRSHQFIAGLASAATLAFAAPAFAQPAGMGPGAGPGTGCGQGMGYGQGMGRGMGPMGHMHGMGGRGGMMGANPAAMVEAHLAYLKTDLKITAGQESAWNAFAAKARKQAEGMHAFHDKMRDGAGTVPERMEIRAEAMKQRAAGMEAMAGAVKDLYAALTPEQKAVADNDFAAHHRGPGAWNGPRR